MTLETISHFFAHNPVVITSIGLSAVIATLVYILSFSDVFKKEISRRRMKRRIESLKNHYILCGCGRVGYQVAKELANEGEPFVVIEKDQNKLKAAREANWCSITGDVAVDENLLVKAQIASAKAVIIAVGTDADGLFIAISARALRLDIFIIARASSVEAADKLQKIGVNRVALPYQIGGYHMATMALRPMVVDFLDLLIDNKQDDLEMEELTIDAGGFYDGKTLKQAGLAERTISVPIIRRATGKAVVNPAGEVTLQGGDRLVAMGAQKDLLAMLDKFEENEPAQKNDAPPSKPTGLAGEIKPSPFLNT